MLDAESPYYTASLVKLLIAIDEVHPDGAWQRSGSATEATR